MTTSYTRQFTQLQCRKKGATAPRGGRTIDTIVVHYTATDSLPRSSPSERGIVLCERAKKAGNVAPADLRLLRERYEKGERASDAAMLCLINSANMTRTASWHYCIASKQELGYTVDAEIVEYVRPELQAHHVGALGLQTNVRSIGIECCYPGPAPRKECPTEASARDWYKNRGWDPSTVFRRKGPDGLWRYWAEQPFVQAEALRFLCLNLCTFYEQINAICSHHLFSPKRRIDPDPPIFLDELRRFLRTFLGREFYDRPQS